MPLTLTGIKGIEVKYIVLKYLIQERLMSILNEQKNNENKPLRLSSLKRKQRTGQKDDEATVANEFMHLCVEFGQMNKCSRR